MFILVDKKTKEIKLSSVGKIKYNSNIFDLIEVNDEKLDGNTCIYKDNKIEKTKIISNKDIAKEMIDNANSVKDIKEILKKLL